MAFFWVKTNAVDSGEQLLQVGLDHHGLGRLAQDLQKVVVADEIEPAEEDVERDSCPLSLFLTLGTPIASLLGIR